MIELFLPIVCALHFAHVFRFWGKLTYANAGPCVARCRCAVRDASASIAMTVRIRCAAPRCVALLFSPAAARHCAKLISRRKQFAIDERS